MPWDIKPLARQLQSLARGYIPVEPAPQVRIRNQPSPGILLAYLGTDEAAVTYDAHIVKRLESDQLSQWILLPDAHRAAAVEPSGTITLVPLK